MMTYLERRGAMYRFRRVVPPELRPFFTTASGKPRTEFSESLGTKDRREAEKRCLDRARATTALLDEAREHLKGGPPPIIRPRPMQAMTPEQIEAMEAAGAENAQAHFEWEEREATRRQLLKGVRENTDTVALALRDLLDDDLLESEAARKQRQTDLEADWRAGAVEFAEGWAASRGIATLPTYPTLSGLFEDFLTEAKPEPATIKRWRPVIAHLIRHIGHDNAERLTTTDVREWRQALLVEAVDGKPIRGPRTVRETYLAALKVVLNVAVQNGRLTENVAAVVKQRVPRTVQLRERDFTDDEVTKILSATLLNQGESIAPEHALARRWVPWLCAYTGARVNEITQLRAQDVAQIGDVWTIAITPEAGSVKTKKARIVPMHSHLIEQGFPEVAKSKSNGPLFYDPKRSQRPSASSPQHKKVGERLAAWVRKLGVDDPSLQPNHAWRHTFKTKARLVQMDPEAREGIPGHARGTEGQKYGTLPLPFLKKELEKLPRYDVR